MQFQLFRGNPLVLVIVSTIFSVFTFVYTLSSFLKGVEIPIQAELFILFVLIYNAILIFALYYGFRKSEYAFMSPKKYKHALLIVEKNQKLKDELERVNPEYKGISPDKAIDCAIDILKKNN